METQLPRMFNIFEFCFDVAYCMNETVCLYWENFRQKPPCLSHLLKGCCTFATPIEVKLKVDRGKVLQVSTFRCF